MVQLQALLYPGALTLPLGRAEIPCMVGVQCALLSSQPVERGEMAVTAPQIPTQVK